MAKDLARGPGVREGLPAAWELGILMRRLSIALAAALVAAPVAAAEIRECSADVKLSAPGEFVRSGALPQFRWTAEPVGTTTRDVVIFPLDDTTKQSVGKAEPFKVRLVVGDGSFGWFVVFRDESGATICRSQPGTFTVGRPTLPPGIVASLSGQGGAVFDIFMRDGRYVIVLAGSAYTGPYSYLINGNDYDGSASDHGLEIYGNANNNVVVGSQFADLIYVMQGDDHVTGLAGQDEIHLGTSVNFDIASTKDNELDTIYFSGVLAPDGDLTELHLMETVPPPYE